MKTLLEGSFKGTRRYSKQLRALRKNLCQSGWCLLAGLLIFLILYSYFGKRLLRPSQNAFKIAFYRTDPFLLGRDGVAPECCQGLSCTRPRTGRFAVLTYLRDDSYIPLFHHMECTFRKSNPDIELVFMTVKGELNEDFMKHIESLNITTKYVEALDFPNSFEPRYGRNWLKLRTWDFVEYDSLLLLDADVVVLDDVSELFALPTNFAGVQDQAKWLGHFQTVMTGIHNGGVLFMRPCKETYNHMLYVLEHHPKLLFTHGAAEQEFLSWYFRYTAFTLPLEYNVMAGPSLQSDVVVGGRKPKIVHFTEFKPFLGNQGLPGHQFLCSDEELATRFAYAQENQNVNKD